MTEKNFRIKIKSIISDLTAFNLCADMIGLENAVEAAEDDIIEYSTDAHVRENGDNIELSYNESSEMGMENTVTTLVFEKSRPNQLSMVRSGDNSAGLVFSDVIKRQPCSYSVAGYTMDFCICTRHIDNRITLSGGTLELDYTIEMQGVKTQRNRFFIKLDELREA